MNIPSMKKFLISRFSFLPNIEGFEDNDINLLTPAGIISGKIFKLSDTNKENSPVDLLVKVTSNIAKEYKDTYNIETVPDNDGFIVLQDVKLRQTGASSLVNLPQLTVFYDQIIGIFFGNLSIDG